MQSAWSVQVGTLAASILSDQQWQYYAILSNFVLFVQNVAENWWIENKGTSQIKTKYVLKHFMHMVLLFKNYITIIL
jgi:hypothetical protein